MITVRRGHRGDLDTLTAFSLGVAEEAEGKRPHPATVRAAIADALDSGKARFFVAEDDGETVGSCFVTSEWSDWSNAWYWWIQAVFVRPKARGLGVWDRLYRAVQRAAGEAGDVARIRLYVNEENLRARAVYERVGMALEPQRIYDAPVAGFGSR